MDLCALTIGSDKISVASIPNTTTTKIELENITTEMEVAPIKKLKIVHTFLLIGSS